MTTITDPNAAADAARNLVEERVETIRRAAESQQHVLRAQQELADLQATAAADYATARKAGWTERELAQCGLAKPDGPAPRKRRAPASRQAAPAPQANGTEGGSQDGDQDHTHG